MAESRICIIGNSHVAAWKGGLNGDRRIASRYTFDFFAAQSDLMRDMALQGNKLVPTSEVTRRRMAMVSGGKSEIGLDEYSCFVVIGLGFDLVKPMEVFRGFRIHGFPSQGAEDNLPYLSRPCFAEMIASFLRHSTATDFCLLLRQVTSARIVLVPQPLPCETILRSPYWRRLVANGLYAHTLVTYEGLAVRLAEELQVGLLLQPEETRTKDMLTRQMYSHGSIRLAPDMSTPHPDFEPFHMNAVFGAIMLEKLVDTLGE